MNTMENHKEGRKSGQVTAKHAATAHLKKRPSALLSFTPIALLVIMLVRRYERSAATRWQERRR